MWKLCVLVLSCAAVAHTDRRDFSVLQCPSTCYCFRRTVRCMKLDLTEIPRAPLHTITFDLRFNQIRYIPPSIFKGQKHIATLLLNNNFLTSLKNGSFEGLHQLRNLYLYKNRIKYIEPDVFQGLKKLERLYLHNNEIAEFQAGTFSSLPSLDRLNLYNNHIQRIPLGAFQKLPHLTRLRLDHNALICDCEMAWLAKMLSENTIQGSVYCKYPAEMYGKSLLDMQHRDFHCKPPKITESPSNVEVSWGGTALFTCKAHGDPTPSIQWMKNNEKVNVDNSKYNLMHDGSLMIRNSSDEDGGYYECMARNADGEVKSRPARMTVVHPEEVTQGSPRLLVVPENVVTVAGAAQAVLRCRAVGYPPPIVRWSKDGVQLQATDRLSIESDGTLTLRPVRPEDHGTYRCDAHNYNGTISAEANIFINVAPIFTIQPENADVDVGATVKLDCVASGSPPPEVAWFKNDEEVVSEGRVFLNEDGSLLQISEAQVTDSGLYICEAKNPLGIREVSARVTVNQRTRSPPTLVYKPYNVEAIVGSTIELPCKADGDPKPGITWQKDGSSMQRTGRFKVSLTGNLYLYNVVPEDQGIYECSAINEHGRVSASGYVTVKTDSAPPGLGVGNKFVKIALSEARDEVDKSINKTIDNFFNSKGPHSPSELFRIIRYPDAPARELARAAEIYERTLSNIRKHIQRGMSMNTTEEFNYQEALSPEHLDLIAKLSGCATHRLKRNCTDMCFHAKYRSIDGTCNNLQNPTWGASLTGFRRILRPIYEDGFAKPIGWNKGQKYNGFVKPSSRKVSTTLIKTTSITPDPEITHMVMQWGQFLDHDIDHALPSVSSASYEGIDCKKSCDYAAPCYPMDVPEDDPRIKNRRCIDFVRTAAVCGSGMTSIFFDTVQYREQINQLTSFIDASQVYGFSEELAKDLRDLDSDGGRLRVGVVFPGRKPLLPYAGNQGIDCRRNLSESTVNCFVAGDIRANEQSGLTAMHTIWMREHNRVARELKELNPHWDTDMLYHETRKIIGAAMQHITYKQWLPYIIGEKGMEMLRSYSGYNPTLNPSISNVFATAALRFGHSLINPVLERLDWDFKPIKEGNLPLAKAFFSPWRIVEEGGIDPLLRGLYVTAAKLKKSNENLNDHLTEHLFETAHAVALDLAAMNVHRSRDHAIPGYNEFRKFCNMSSLETFDDLRHEITDPEVRRKLRDLYGHPANIDVWVGGILEDQADGARVGPLFRCLLIEQFGRLRDGDRFYYENPSSFKPEQLVQLQQYSLSRVLCDNGDNITRISHDLFKLPYLQKGLVKCEEIPKVDFRMWSECCSDCRYTGQLNTISRLNARRNRRHLDDLDDSYLGFTPAHQYSNVTVSKIQETAINDEDVFVMKRRISKLENEIDELKKILKKTNKMLKRMKNSYDF